MAFLTVSQIAERLGISRWTAWIWIRQGQLKGFKLGHRWVIEEDELEKFIQKCREGKIKTDDTSPFPKKK